MNFILLSFAFIAELQVFFVPCSIALIPAYIGCYVRQEPGEKNKIRQLLFGLKAGGFASLGFLSIYAIFGIIE